MELTNKDKSYSLDDKDMDSIINKFFKMNVIELYQTGCEVDICTEMSEFDNMIKTLERGYLFTNIMIFNTFFREFICEFIEGDYYIRIIDENDPTNNVLLLTRQKMLHILKSIFEVKDPFGIIQEMEWWTLIRDRLPMNNFSFEEVKNGIAVAYGNITTFKFFMITISVSTDVFARLSLENILLN